MRTRPPPLISSDFYRCCADVPLRSHLLHFMMAIGFHGTARRWLGLRRLARCHPFNPDWTPSRDGKTNLCCCIDLDRFSALAAVAQLFPIYDEAGSGKQRRVRPRPPPFPDATTGDLRRPAKAAGSADLAPIVQPRRLPGEKDDFTRSSRTAGELVSLQQSTKASRGRKRPKKNVDLVGRASRSHRLPFAIEAPTLLTCREQCLYTVREATKALIIGTAGPTASLGHGPSGSPGVPLQLRGVACLNSVPRRHRPRNEPSAGEKDNQFITRGVFSATTASKSSPRKAGS